MQEPEIQTLVIF